MARGPSSSRAGSSSRGATGAQSRGGVSAAITPALIGDLNQKAYEVVHHLPPDQAGKAMNGFGAWLHSLGSFASLPAGGTGDAITGGGGGGSSGSTKGSGDQQQRTGTAG